MPEMHAGLEKLLQGHLSHVSTAGLLFLFRPVPAFRRKDRGFAPGVLTQSAWDWLSEYTQTG